MAEAEGRGLEGKGLSRKQRGRHQKGEQGGEEPCSCWKGSGCPWRARGKQGEQARMKQPGNCRRGGENGAGLGHLFIPAHTRGYERSDSGRTESNVPVSLSRCPPPPPPECAQQEESGLDIIWSWTSGWVCPSLRSLCSDGRLPDSRRCVLGSLQLQHALLSYIWPLLLQRQMSLLDALLPRS